VASWIVPGATCLTQALATQIQLGRHGHKGRVHIGVALDPQDGFQAHAWIESGGVLLAGGSEAGRYRSMLVLEF
jgi:hypothetical protein